MSKVIVYWSQTGNTEAMALALQEVVNGDIFNVADIDADKVKEYDLICLGCPAMGSEELEGDEFEPFFSDLEASLNGKKVFLFGSYDWGDGQWMRDWEDRVREAGADLVNDEGFIVNNTPDVSDLEALKAIGQSL